MSEERKEAGDPCGKEGGNKKNKKKTELRTEEEGNGEQRKRARRVAEKDVEEEELEEFFSILRRMQHSLNYFKNARGREGKEFFGLRGWRAMLDKEILAGRPRSRRKEESGVVEENPGLDLNADPQPVEDDTGDDTAINQSG